MINTMLSDFLLLFNRFLLSMEGYASYLLIFSAFISDSFIKTRSPPPRNVPWNVSQLSKQGTGWIFRMVSRVSRVSRFLSFLSLSTPWINQPHLGDPLIYLHDETIQELARNLDDNLVVNVGDAIVRKIGTSSTFA